MEIITIDAKPFFAKVRDNNKSMWDMLSLLIDGNHKLIRFVDEQGQTMMEYVLPTHEDKLRADQKEFATMLKNSIDAEHKAKNN